MTSHFQRPPHTPDLTLGALLRDQFAGLLTAVGAGAQYDSGMRLLETFLGDVVARRVGAPPAWPSDVADDHSPVEWSVAFEPNRAPSVRILVEPIAAYPSHRSNTRHALSGLNRLLGHHGLSTNRLLSLGDLFFPQHATGLFALWYSIVLRDEHPEVKAYLNPAAGGPANSAELVREALHRLGFGEGFRVLQDSGLSRGPGLDSCGYFALDLNDGPDARVKVYVSHRAASADDAVRAAKAVPGIDLDQVREFCRLAGDQGDRHDRRPLMSSYSFLSRRRDTPSGYSLYIPVRDYVADDREARERVIAVLERFGHDPTGCEDAIAAVARRPLEQGRGLISHISLRMGVPRPGVTVYLSTEIYGVKPVQSGRPGVLALARTEE
ncbi:tryptophan dimethylallyltransferase family protein [Plantactinospora endophytica]|uniref:Prenyltransferase n=1 Tax=Plantactinospora endophytica TaxID=673535 RepID=A0ABQ4EBL4_9ACTN|nr:tryptophan dimethylallyltransferase family protein [Plantactinospora endophytica]GIG92127.1 prenyltransferase [Plantactinospora endophytica]